MENRSKSLPLFLDERLSARFIKWTLLVLAAAGTAGAVLFWMSIPGKALNSYNEAQRLFDTGKYANALYAANEAMRDHALRLKVYRLRADIYRALQQPKEAVADITRVIDLQPGVVANYDFRAKTYLEMEDPADAASDYTRVIELTKSAESYSERARAYMKMKDAAKAIADLTQAIALDPCADYYLQRGLARSESGDQQQAISDLNRALELEPTSTTAVYSYRARGVAKQKSGDASGGVADLEKAEQLEATHILGSKPGF